MHDNDENEENMDEEDEDEDDNCKEKLVVKMRVVVVVAR